VAAQKLNLARLFNDDDFGGQLIANGVAPFTAKHDALHTIEPAVDAKAK
jgi:hypothetical protein